uniref:Reverse transcriptase domain-containing protein n=1 Tax=Tanacetum cinerariifolium TaxID=118510 RepID=A0A699H911_TANCI|nr:reverse transcriptase domain-containing protein [Tanacetum cinerariifolium]
MSRSPEPNPSVFSRIRRDRPESPRHRPGGKGRRDGGVFNRLRSKRKSVFAHLESRHQSYRSRRTKPVPKKHYHEGTSSRDPFPPHIRYFDIPKKIRMPSNVKTYDESDDPEDHLKFFQAATKVERWKMPTWCHMFNSTLTGSARIKVNSKLHHNDNTRKKRNNKFCEFHGEVRHNTDECMHLKRQIEELIKDRKLSYVIKELKQGSGKDQPKAAKKGEASGKDKDMAILMVQPWQRVARHRITQSFSPNPEISFPTLGEENGVEGPMVIEVEIESHFIHRIYVQGGLVSEILYEHCFNRLCPEVKSQTVSSTAPLIDFSGEIIWPMGQILLLVKIGDAKHLTSAWMNFVVVMSPSSYNWIIGRPKELRGICRRPGNQKAHGTRNNKGHRRNVQDLKRNKYEAKPQEMHLWDARRYVLRIQGKHQGDKEKSLPFFKTLKKYTKKSDFQWTTKAEAAFKQMKILIAELPMLTVPLKKEELIVYLAATREAVIVVLMTERETKQMPIYFAKNISQGNFLADFIVERQEYDLLAAPMEIEEELSNTDHPV